MPRCSRCWEYVEHGANPNVLIDPHTQQGHKCNPAKLRVPDGLWRGYTFEEMARMWEHRRGKRELDRIREQCSDIRP